jgi:hypothetical protein
MLRCWFPSRSSAASGTLSSKRPPDEAVETERPAAMSRTGRRARVLVAGCAAFSLLLPTSMALSSAGDADAAVDVYAPDEVVAGQPTQVQVDVADYGEDPALSVSVEISVSGGVLLSVADDAQGDGSLQCGVPTQTQVTCTASSLSSSNYPLLDLSVRWDTPGSAGVTAVVSSSDDTNADDNEADAPVDVVVPPSATLTATASPDPDNDAEIVQGELSAAGAAVWGDPVDLYVKVKGSPDSTYTFVDEQTTGDDEGDGHVSFDVDDGVPGVAAGGAYTFELVHPATPQAGEVVADVDASPRPVTVSLHVPATRTYSDDNATVNGSVAYADGRGPIPSGELVLQARPAGSDDAWKTLGSDNESGTASFPYEVFTRNTELRLLYVSQSPGSADGSSAVKTVIVRQAVKATISPRAIPPGGHASVRVVVGPRTGSSHVTLQRAAGKGWKTVGTGQTSTSGTRQWTYRFSAVQKVRYRVHAAATSTNAANDSAVATLTVEKHAGGKPGEHAFLYRDGSHIARWNPCATIGYRVNLRQAPTGALADVKETLRRIAQITRLRYHYEGHTHEIPNGEGKQHEKLLIAWARPGQTDLPLGGGTIGYGGGLDSENTPKNLQIVKGYAVLDSTQKLTAGFGAGLTEGELLMHELGHATGLDHPTARSQIMYPDMLSRSSAMYGAGDYRGLTLLGRSQGCIAPIKAARRLRPAARRAPAPGSQAQRSFGAAFTRYSPTSY